MSLSKRFYDEGYQGKPECKRPLLDIGKRFTINSSYYKINKGRWEIVSNKHAPSYSCRRVLKNGSLTKSDSENNVRMFHESEIYSSLES